MKITLGSFNRATENKARTSFSPSPTHFDVKELAEMLKKVALHWEATHRPEVEFKKFIGKAKTRREKNKGKNEGEKDSNTNVNDSQKIGKMYSKN